MKYLVLGAACAAMLWASPAAAQGGGNGGNKGNGAPKGKFEKFMLVAPGNPNTTQTDLTNYLKNDNSNGRAIFIPVKTANGPKELYCEAADGTGSFIIGDQPNANLGEVEPIDGVKINFVKNSALTSMDIVDRDATDGYAEIQVPGDWANATSVDLYMRVLGASRAAASGPTPSCSTAPTTSTRAPPSSSARPGRAHLSTPAS